MRLATVTARLVRDDRGIEVVEYAVLTALLVGGTIVALVALLNVLVTQNQTLANLLNGV